MIRTSITNYIFFILVFIVFFVFYTQIHPLVPYDTDDWLNLTTSRGFYPSLKQWNPTKVFPECLESLVGTFAAFVLTPLLGDYLNALVAANAATLALFITFYLYQTQNLLVHKFKLGYISSIYITILFAIMHYMAFRVAKDNNEYLWYSHNCNCIYHYTISSLLAGSLVLWLLGHNIKRINNSISKFLLILVTYLVLLSNLFSSVILIAYSGAMLIINIFNKYKSFLSFIKQNLYYIIVILVWLAIQLIEVNGKRANDYGNLNEPLWEEVIVAIKKLFTIHKNYIFLYSSLIIFLISKLHHWKKSSQGILHLGKPQMAMILAFFFSLTYQLLLASRVHPQYIKQRNVIFAFAIFFMFLLLFCLGYLSSKTKYFKFALPFLIFFALFESNTKYNTYKGVQSNFGINGHVCLEHNRNFIQQVIDADKMGKDTVWIKVPQYRPKDLNWPLMTSDSQFFGETLYKHNITSRKIVTLYLPSEKYPQ